MQKRLNVYIEGGPFDGVANLTNMLYQWCLTRDATVIVGGVPPLPAEQITQTLKDTVVTIKCSYSDSESTPSNLKMANKIKHLERKRCLEICENIASACDDPKAAFLVRECASDIRWGKGE